MGQKIGTVLGSYNKAANEFEIGFDTETDLSFYVGFYEGFKYDMLDGLSLGV